MENILGLCWLYPQYFYPGFQELPQTPIINESAYLKEEPNQEPKKYQRTWTKSELENIFNITVQYCQDCGKTIDQLTLNDFSLIAIGKKQTPEQVMKKIKEVNSNGTLRPGRWSQQEDEMLTTLVNKNTYSWGDVALILNSELHCKLSIRNSKTCKERWNNYLNPEIKRGIWTKEEDKLILQEYLKHGNKWKTISKILPRRIEGAVKNRIKSLVNKIKLSLQPDEDINTKIQQVCDGITKIHSRS